MYDIKEFLRVTNAYHNTAIVDDDFSEMKERYQLEFARLERAVKENGFSMAANLSADILNEVGVELAKARQTHAPMNGHHEGYAVMLEEMDELWEVCKRNTHSFETERPKWAIHVDPLDKEALRRLKRSAMRKEALQIAAMAVRFIQDVCDKHSA